MLSKNITSKILNTRTTLALAGVLLSSAFGLPSWAMDPNMDYTIKLGHPAPTGGIGKYVRSKEEIAKMWERPAASTYYFKSLEIEMPSSVVDETPISFAQMSQIHPTLEAVKINKTSMGGNDRGKLRIKELAENLKTNNTIKLVRLSKCAVDDEGATHLADMLKVNTVVTHLYLDFNNISDVGATALAESLKVNKTLQLLSFVNSGSGHKMTDEAVLLFGRALGSRPNKTPFTLDLGGMRVKKTPQQVSPVIEKLKTINVILKF